MTYSHTDKWNRNTEYQMGFNAQAQNLIEKISKGEYDLATDIAKQLTQRNGWEQYGASVSEKQAYVLARTAFEQRLVKGETGTGKTIFNYDARNQAKREAEIKQKAREQKKQEYNSTFTKSMTKVEKGAIVYDDKGNKATIDRVITASTGYVQIRYDNGVVKKQMAFNLKGEDGNPLKKKKF